MIPYLSFRYDRYAAQILTRGYSYTVRRNTRFRYGLEDPLNTLPNFQVRQVQTSIRYPCVRYVRYTDLDTLPKHKVQYVRTSP